MEWGLLIGVDNHRSAAPILYTIDSNGKRDEIRFQLPDAALINLSDFAIAVDGEIGAIGSAYTIDGKGTSFVARVSADRTQQTVTRTWPYVALAVTIASDGSLWTIGRLKDEANTVLVAEPVLRRFDKAGKLLGSSVTLKARGSNSIETSSMAASQDRVAWLTRHGEYIEFSLDGKEIGRFQAPEGTGDFGISEENDVIATDSSGGKTEFLVLDRSTGTWEPLSLPEGARPNWARILGFDKGTLVTTSSNGSVRRFKAQ